MSTFWDDPPPQLWKFTTFFFRMNPSLMQRYLLQVCSRYTCRRSNVPQSLHSSRGQSSRNIPSLDHSLLRQTRLRIFRRLWRQRSHRRQSPESEHCLMMAEPGVVRELWPRGQVGGHRHSPSHSGHSSDNMLGTEVYKIIRNIYFSDVKATLELQMFISVCLLFSITYKASDFMISQWHLNL